MPAAGEEGRLGGNSTESALAASITTCTGENSPGTATNRRVPLGYGPTTSYSEFSCALPPAFPNNSGSGSGVAGFHQSTLQNNNYLSYQDTSSVAALAATQASNGSSFLDLSASSNCCTLPSNNPINTCNRLSNSNSTTDSQNNTAHTMPMYPWMSIVGG